MSALRGHQGVAALVGNGISRFAGRLAQQCSSRAEPKIRRLFMSAARRSNPLRLSMNGHKVEVWHRGTSADLFVIWQCFYQNQYNFPITEFHRPFHQRATESLYRRILSSGKQPLIVDCGANIGTSVLWFHTRYPEARIIAIEPAADNIALLRRNCHIPEVRIVHAAVAGTDGRMVLVDPGESTNGYRVVSSDSQGSSHGREVDAISLNTVLADTSSENVEEFILKVDIEGSEKALFSDSWETFDRFPVILVEQHDFMMPGQSTAQNFFKYHASRQRDFLFGSENIFSIDYNRIEL